MVSAIHAKPCSLISNLNLFLPEAAVMELFLLNWYPAVTLTSLIIFSAGLKAINNLASLLFDFGACKMGDDCAKKLRKNIGKIIIIFLIMDRGLDILFALY